MSEQLEALLLDLKTLGLLAEEEDCRVKLNTRCGQLRLDKPTWYTPIVRAWYNDSGEETLRYIRTLMENLEFNCAALFALSCQPQLRAPSSSSSTQTKSQSACYTSPEAPKLSTHEAKAWLQRILAALKPALEGLKRLKQRYPDKPHVQQGFDLMAERGDTLTQCSAYNSQTFT